MKLIRTFGRSAATAELAIQTLEARGAASTAQVEPIVRAILASIKKDGDKALTKYATKFDSLAENQPLQATKEEMQEAWNSLAPKLQLAMQTAQANIRAFAEGQKQKEWMTSPSAGIKTGQIVRPLASVGCYVPGGRYPLPSTLLMTVTPAQVAGVERIVVCSPKPAPETLAAAHLGGITEFYRIGGAQAIAALAYGTESITAVDKIVGPGNLYVTAAKQLVSTICGIDMPAGPTEIVVTSETGKPEDIAADLVAQAEHDPETLAVLITTNEALAKAVAVEVKQQSKSNPLAKLSIAARGHIFVTKSVTESQTLTNRLAPEHLTVDTLADLAWVRNAGSVFVGPFAPQAMGDYISGPNHVLPTGRNGRVRGGLSVMDFLKVITVQQYTRKGLRALGPHSATLADAEGLTRTRRKRKNEDEMSIAIMTVQPRKLVDAMPEYHPPLAARTALRLDFNENTFAPSPRVLERLLRTTAEDLTKYPEREPVERIVAAHFNFAPEQVLLTNGVDEAIRLLCLAFLDPADEALIATPTFFMYDVSVKLMTSHLVRIQAAEDFEFPYARFLAAITPKTKLIMIASPNNPTGIPVSREHILALCAAAPHAVVFADEAYYHFHGESVLADVAATPNLVVGRTFSKAYGLANLRLGMLAGQSEIMHYIRKVCSPYNVNGLALDVLPVALEDDAYVRWYSDQVATGRERTMDGLRALGVAFFPSAANFILMKIGPKHRELCEAMRAHGVLLRDRSTDPGCEGYVRVTIGIEDHVTRGLAALKTCLDEIGWSPTS